MQTIFAKSLKKEVVVSHCLLCFQLNPKHWYFGSTEWNKVLPVSLLYCSSLDGPECWHKFRMEIFLKGENWTITCYLFVALNILGLMQNVHCISCLKEKRGSKVQIFFHCYRNNMSKKSLDQIFFLKCRTTWMLFETCWSNTRNLNNCWWCWRDEWKHSMKTGWTY